METLEARAAHLFDLPNLKAKHATRYQNSYAYRVGCFNGRDARIALHKCGPVDYPSLMVSVADAIRAANNAPYHDKAMEELGYAAGLLAS